MLVNTRTSEVFNEDCMTGMARYEDKWFDLAAVDPEYRNDNQPTQHMRAKGNMKKWQGKSDINFFKELFRISKHQIIWGGNYYTSFLDENNNWIIWYKNNDGTGFSMAEMAWCSITKNVKVFEKRAPQTLQHEGVRIHPTQKPIALYDWIYKNYLPNGGRVIDTHLGSGSNRIAAHKAGNIDFVGFEIDPDYFEAQEKRWKGFIAQTRLF